MRNSLKKSLAIAGVVAAVFAGSAFASEQVKPVGSDITWQQDQQNQSQAQNANAKFDKEHGYTNMKKDSKMEVKPEKSEVRQEAKQTNETWKKDIKTQKEARQKNAKFDKEHGYTNMGKHTGAPTAEASHKRAEVKHETKKTNEAWKKDIKTQEEAQKENASFDKQHGYNNMPQKPAEAK